MHDLVALLGTARDVAEERGCPLNRVDLPPLGVEQEPKEALSDVLAYISGQIGVLVGNRTHSRSHRSDVLVEQSAEHHDLANVERESRIDRARREHARGN
jgi:hypothetical protein